MIDPKTVSSELEDSALKRAQAKSDMADANEAIQHAQNALGDAQRRFLAHDGIDDMLRGTLEPEPADTPSGMSDHTCVMCSKPLEPEACKDCTAYAYDAVGYPYDCRYCDCHISPISSRVCQRGTKCCTVQHSQ